MFYSEMKFVRFFIIFQLNKMEQAASNKVMKLDLRRYHTGSRYG